MTHFSSLSSDSFVVRLRRAAVRVLLPALAFACLTVSSGVHAQELNARGNLVFGAERLFGFYLDQQNTEIAGADVDNDTTVVGIGWSLTNPSALLSIPRLGVDYFIDEHLTVGGSFGLASVSVENGDTLGFLIHGRVGYALRLSHMFSFWPRGGLTYASLGNDADLSVFAVTLEGMFTLAPTDGWAFMGGPVIDLGFAGGNNDNDHSEFLFGLMFGIVGWFEV